MKTVYLFTAVFLTLVFITSSSAILAQNSLKTFRDCTDCPEMVALPAGNFLIGTPETESGRSMLEGPQKLVHIKSFAVGKFDITKGQWAKFVSETHREILGGCAWSGLKDSVKPWKMNANASWKHLGFSQDDNHPVVCVSSNDVDDYLQWLSKTTGHHYRLLSESEWEYAARAGTTTAFPWGPVASHEYANYGLDSGFKGTALGRDRWAETSPVGSFPANAFGLYDMHGNVLQFVEDCFENSYDSLPDDGSPYKKNSSLPAIPGFKSMYNARACTYRIVRGGDWGDPPGMIRSGFRNWAPASGSTLATYKSAGLGFRVARDL